MPGRLTNEELHDLLLNTLEEDGWTVYLPNLVTGGSFELHAQGSHRTFSVAIRLYSLTDDARKKGQITGRLKIQTTGQTHFHPSLPTALLGANWIGGLAVFAGFDAQKHFPAGGKSNNIQVSEDVIYRSLRSETGYEIQEKSDGEKVIGISPNYLAEYLQNPGILHGHTTPSPAFPEIEPPRERPRRLIQTSVVYRDKNFRPRVMGAYRGRCAMCELQVGMPQAAHIKPVQYAIDDRVNNGIPLCPNHHDAFDRNQLISVNKEGQILINIARIEHFQKHGIDHKIEVLLGPLRENLLPPDNAADRPDPDCLEKRNDLDSSGKATNWMTVTETRSRGII